MTRSLTAADRSALIRLASTMPVGSGERRAILAGLSRTAAGNVPGRHIRENAQVSDNAHVYSYARAFGNASVSGNAYVGGKAKVYGEAMVYDKAMVSDDAQVYGEAMVYDKAMVYEKAQVYGNASVRGNARIGGNAKVYGTARIGGSAAIVGGEWDGSEGEILSGKWTAPGVSEGAPTLTPKAPAPKAPAPKYWGLHAKEEQWKALYAALKAAGYSDATPSKHGLPNFKFVTPKSGTRIEYAIYSDGVSVSSHTPEDGWDVRRRLRINRNISFGRRPTSEFFGDTGSSFSFRIPDSGKLSLKAWAKEVVRIVDDSINAMWD